MAIESCTSQGTSTFSSFLDDVDDGESSLRPILTSTNSTGGQVQAFGSCDGVYAEEMPDEHFHHGLLECCFCCLDGAGEFGWVVQHLNDLRVCVFHDQN